MTEPVYLTPGAVLQDRYEVLREIGRGGYSVVYAARDRKLGVAVAIKLLMPPPAVARLARERMRREVQVVRSFTHPNIVAVYDLVEEGPWGFIVMEFVAGPDLHVRLRDHGPLGVEEAVRIGQDIAAALGAAHRRGILHRDVKPQNILLDPDGRARLTDFGSAKLDTQATVTQTGGLVGTLDYTAPEVIAGRRGDARSDIYGLGMTLYYALVGKLPERPSPHLPPPPAAGGYRPRALRTNLPEWLDEVVARATAAEPEERFPAAQTLSDALAGQLRQDEFSLERPAVRLESCLVCGAPEPFGLGVCPQCSGASAEGADTLVFVERTSRGTARRAMADALAVLLGPGMPAAGRQSVARGERPLVRVPAAVAPPVIEMLALHDIAARAVPVGRAWTVIPLSFYGLVGAVVVLGVAAGAAAAPILLWTSPMVAALLVSAARLGVGTPLWRARRQATPLPKDVAAQVIRAFERLPAGTARSLLADLVRRGKVHYSSLSRTGDEPGIRPALAQVLVAACGAAIDLAQLEENLASFDAQRERLATPPAAWLDALTRCERARDTLVQRLLEATTVLGALPTQSAELPTSAGAELAELTRELETEAALRANAAKEIAELLGETTKA